MGSTIKCPSCNEEITSKHRHDYVTCKCGKTSIDGGNDYRKINFDPKIGFLEKNKNGKWVRNKTSNKVVTIFKRIKINQNKVYFINFLKKHKTAISIVVCLFMIIYLFSLLGWLVKSIGSSSETWIEKAINYMGNIYTQISNNAPDLISNNFLIIGLFAFIICFVSINIFLSPVYPLIIGIFILINFGFLKDKAK